MSKQTQWTLPIQEDPETGEFILEFPDAVLEETGWEFGDTIKWIDNGDGSWTLKKVDRKAE